MCLSYRKIVLLLSVVMSFPSFALEWKDEKHGYWWYEDIAVKKKEVKESGKHPKPTLPSQAKMMKMHPDDLKKILDNHLKHAIHTLNPDDVENYFKVQDVVRRKSSAFTAVSSYVMLQHPELNAKSAYPTTGAGRNVYKQQIERMVHKKLVASRDKYAFGFLTKEGCAYCAPMRATLKLFQEKHNWRIQEFDIDKHNGIATRFNATVTPMLIMIEKGSERWMPVAVGVEPLTSIEQGAYRTIRLLEGDIKPEQFYTNEQAQGGFFDPAKQGGA